jgi:methylglutaconyl-CoA hydratase
MNSTESMAYNTLTLEYDAALAGNLVTVTLNRPEKRNAISVEMIEELLSALDAIQLGPSRVVMITGAGQAFCSGMDLDELKTLATQSTEENLAGARRTSRLFRYLWSYSKPLIAAVNGPALAGGCGIATLCDFTLAGEQAKFGYTEVRVGFIPALVALYLERQVGEKIARDLLLTGRVIDAEEAFRLGLVTRVVPAAELLSSARALAATLISNSPGALAATKRLLVKPSEVEIDRRIELAIAESVAIRATSDFTEGLAAFLEKRKPHWTGR